MTILNRVIPPSLWVAIPELGHDIRVETTNPVQLRIRPTRTTHSPAQVAPVPPQPAAPCGHRRQPGTWL